MAARLLLFGSMAGFKDFREIAAWRLSREVKILAYPIVKRAAAAHDFKFRDQLQDAARSAPRNIAEGFARPYAPLRTIAPCGNARGSDERMVPRPRPLRDRSET